MNTRVQVEHPVTEMVTGIDLVKTQIQIACGAQLPWSQDNISFHGHAIEVRITAEDPDTLIPSPGEVSEYHVPGGLGVRVDAALYSGCEVLPFYDSLIAKLIVHGDNRHEAINKVKSALDEFIIGGIKTTIPLFKKIVTSAEFTEGQIDTAFLKRFKG